MDSDPLAAHELLPALATEEVNIIAFSAIPFGPEHVELTPFADDTTKLLDNRQTWVDVVQTATPMVRNGTDTWGNEGSVDITDLPKSARRLHEHVRAL